VKIMDRAHPLALAVLIVIAFGTNSTVAAEEETGAAAPFQNGTPNEISVAQAIQPAPSDQGGQPKATSSTGTAMGEMNADAGSKSGNSETTVHKGSELKPASQAKAGVSGYRQQSASQKAVVKAVNGFAGQTFGQLLNTNTDKNVVISPLGLGTALNLLAAGAGSETAKLLRAGLGPKDLSEGDTLKGLKALAAEIGGASSDQVILRSANAVWVSRGSKPSTEFEKRALDIFSADVQAVDLQSPETVELINQWARRKTDGLVTAAVDRLDPTTRFVLTNAVYFKGTWLTAFDPAKTQPAPFTTVPGVVREVSMMESSLPVRYAQSDADRVHARGNAPPSSLPHGIHAIWLPYQGERVQMLIVAPSEQAPVDSVKQALQKMPLTDLVRSLDRDQSKMLVRVKVPRFTMQFAADVSSTLAQQGLAQPFSAAADYRAISSGQGIISVLHRAVLEVNEKGTTAAATTAVTSDRELTNEPPIFSADKPFLVAIIDRSTGATLFAGYIADLGDDQAQPSTKTGSQ
jgi:serpin B